MSLGLGIFLAALVIAAVMLRDKVRWGRLFLGLILLVAAVASGLYAYSRYKSLPTYQKEYEDIAIGMDRKEVEYVKGLPRFVYVPRLEQKLINEGKSKFEAWIQSSVQPKDLPNGLSVKDTSEWKYKLSGDNWITIYFDEGDRVKRIQCHTSDNDRFACDRVSGIGIGSSEEDAKDVFGTPDSETINFGYKRLRFDKYNIGFTLTKQRVFTIRVGESDVSDD